MSCPVDMFGPLPDEVLCHVLSFLPSREAVQTCCLARRWSHLWKSVPAIRVRGEGAKFLLFVNNLIFERNLGSAPPLHSLEIDADVEVRLACSYCKLLDCDCNFDDYRHRREVNAQVDDWVRHALRAGRARSLRACFGETRWKPRRALPFASPHLTTIHLDAVCLRGGQLDFSCCPALLRLDLVLCSLHGDALVSPSLERLAINDCHTDIFQDPNAPDERFHMSLSTPRLRFVEISDNYDKEQFLEMAPWLTEESISYY
ncbi:hypothetical protein CFC21_034119 [Triticum aestivum]|uniref:F-box domain-containing protein n=2 Tax=Triticum aestivum TaxID=4565 RepID=A0A3B6EB18_WHEAT|nr:hypothetical protein CFC21_034119 [Triticum aestivum]